jgi:hypothetical protein
VYRGSKPCLVAICPELSAANHIFKNYMHFYLSTFVHISSLSLSLPLSVVLRFELRASHLLAKCSATSVMSPTTFFAFNNFSDSASHFCPKLALYYSPSTYVS